MSSHKPFRPLVAAVALGLIVLTLAVTRAGLSAAPTPVNRYNCAWADTPPTLDGKLDDIAWKSAAVVNGFSPFWDKNSKTKVQPTEARMLWDGDYLYYSGRLSDRDLSTKFTKHDDRLWEGDVFELFLKPSTQHPGYYELHVNPAGATMDLYLPKREEGGFEKYVGDGDFHLEAKVALHGSLNGGGSDRSWTVEARIPWRDFLRTGGRPAPGEEWRFAFCRYDYGDGKKDPDLSTSAPLTQMDFHRYEDYSVLKFTGPTAKPFGIDKRIPLTTSKVIGSPDPPHPYHVRRVYPNLKIGYPVAVRRQPGSDWLVAVVNKYPGGPSSLVRFKDDPTATEIQTLLPEVNRLAYDLEFHPKFAENGYLYWCSKGPMDAPVDDKRQRISRFTFKGPERTFDPGSETTIIEWWSDGHDGGAMAFGNDGMFYITSGDGTSDSDTRVTGQSADTLLSKVLRIDVDHPTPGKQYSVPKDNPYVGRAEFAPETWAYGLRNPWRMTCDRQTGHIWVGMNGQDLWEPVYLVKKGANYGWSIKEGSHDFYPQRKPGPTPISPPTIEHPHSEARSLTGGIVYYGKRHPELRGAYIYGDYSTGKIWAAKHDGLKVSPPMEIADCALGIVGFAEDKDGELLIVDIGVNAQGGFYTLDANKIEAQANTFPKKLSDTGLFKVQSDLPKGQQFITRLPGRILLGHEMVPALIPYDVNAPLWSDNAHKERWIALPGDSKIEYAATRGWNFPNGTVLVKSFALGDGPKNRRWIETRLLTRQEGEWVGYSYEWNDAQTDAVLVENKGKDREYQVRDKDAYRKQVWRYPSRAECMVCHSRAANYVLGLTTAQMNRSYDYHGVKDNQLRVLNHLGVLDVDPNAAMIEQVRVDGVAKGLSDAALDAYIKKHSPQPEQRPVIANNPLGIPTGILPKLADPYDKKADLDSRARAYLQSNCANCHVEAGGGNSQFDAEFTTLAQRMKLIDAKPVHHTFDLPDPRLIAPGQPERSVLLRRMNTRGDGFMPPLATKMVDKRAVELMEAWIRSLK